MASGTTTTCKNKGCIYHFDQRDRGREGSFLNLANHSVKLDHGEVSATAIIPRAIAPSFYEHAA
jgi:hypothetical protein